MLPNDKERLETKRVVEQIAALLEGCGDPLVPSAQRRCGGSRWARGGTIVALGLIGTGGSLALATIMQRTAADNRPARAAGGVVGTASPAPHIAAIAVTTIAPQGRTVASVRIAKPPLLASKLPSIEASIPVRQEAHLAVADEPAAPGHDAPSPHLTGEALRLALIEDSAKTRALNLKELAQVGPPGCRKPASERC